MTAYTDGGERIGKAGWGALLLDEKSSVEAELWGPVITEPNDLMHLQASTLSNNTGELSAIAEALLYVLYVDKSNRSLELIYDSTLAGNIANGYFAPRVPAPHCTQARSSR